MQPGPGPHSILARASVSPTHFGSMVVDGLSLASAIEHYLDWIEGRGKGAFRRRRQGVPQPLDRAALLRGGGGTVLGSRGVEIAVRSEPELFALRFIHRDEQHPDVHWHSVVRLRVRVGPAGRPAVEVEHATGRSLPPSKRLPPVTGAPAVLQRLLEIPGVRARGRDVATKVLQIRTGEATDFVHDMVFDQARSLPLLLVSHTKADDTPLVEPSDLQRLLLTQVIVAEIEHNATWEFAKAFADAGFEREFGVCFDGAVRLYHPNVGSRQTPKEHYLWLPDRLDSLGDDATTRLAGEVAERITWRALPARFFSTLEDLDRERSRVRAATALRSEIADNPDRAAKLASLEALVTELKTRVADAQDERADWETEASRYEHERNEIQALLEIAEQERDEANAKRSGVEARVTALQVRESGLPDNQREALRTFARGRVDSLTQALTLVEALFPERVELLPSAWASAAAASEFKKPDKAWELLHILVTDYWVAVQEGGDANGRKCFSDSTFASRESETVEARKGARERRTFIYDDQPTVMWKHLKIGIKDSVHETWRCHFEFDATTRRVVIGHCGAHLDFK